MTEKLEIYRCKICRNTVQIILNGEGELVCCGEKMEKLVPNTTENVTTEYHIPVYKTDNDGNQYIQVGKEKHPMTEEHHIEFIERISQAKNYMYLEYPDNEPVINIESRINNDETALEYCNLHGLWRGNNVK